MAVDVVVVDMVDVVVVVVVVALPVGPATQYHSLAQSAEHELPTSGFHR